MAGPPASDVPASSREQPNDGAGGVGGDRAKTESGGGDGGNALTAADVDIASPAAAASAQPSSSTAQLSEEEKPLCVLVIGEPKDRKAEDRKSSFLFCFSI